MFNRISRTAVLGILAVTPLLGVAPSVSAASSVSDASSMSSTASRTVNAPTAAVGAATVSAASSCLSFAPAALYKTDSPFHVASGYFDADNTLDIAATNYYAGTVSVLLGKGDGTFKSPVSYPAGFDPRGIELGRFNGDSTLDIAVANGSGDVNVLLGKGDGTFQAAKESPATLGQAVSLSSGDFDKDGDLDLAVTSYGGDVVSVVLGDGYGAFGLPVHYPVGSLPIEIGVGDFDKDGDLDLAVANDRGVDSQGAVSVLLGEGDGTFQTAVNYPTDIYSYGLEVGDWNGDHKLDLAVANKFSISTLLGNGDGTFQDLVSNDVAVNVTAVQGDFDGDGTVDIATVPEGSYFSVGLGKGNGTFELGGRFPDMVNGYNTGVAAGDFDADGKLDLVTANIFENSISILLNTTNCAPPDTGGNGDTTAPSVSLVGGPVDGGTYYFGSVPAAPTCEASDAGSGLAGSCSVSGYSNAVGSHTVKAVAVDNAGNRGESASVSYKVLGWNLKGFYQPVDMGGVVNTVKNGSTVPLKFEVFAGGSELTATSVVKSFVQTKINCNTSTPVDEVEITTTGGTSLRYDVTGGQFIQNWQTPKTAGACYRVTMTTQDGSAISALFKLK